ncbi:hypothetical protein PO909_024760 [Leuciscus waleckii]
MEQPERSYHCCRCHMPQEPLKEFQWDRRPAFEGVQRWFLTDCLLAGPQVVGEDLVRILLSDLYEKNDHIPMDSWKGPDRPIGRLTNCWTVASRAAAYLGDVCTKIEELDLSYSRNLVKYREHGMPWLETCIDRLPKCLPKERLMTVLAFLGSVGMIHNGDFVSFQKLGELECQLPVTQKHMQELRILSQLLLVQSPAVWRFHESIPTKLVLPPVVPPRPARPRPPVQEERREVADFEIDEEPEEELVERIQPSTVPASANAQILQCRPGDKLHQCEPRIKPHPSL